jgi:hypothetical protein
VLKRTLSLHIAHNEGLVDADETGPVTYGRCDLLVRAEPFESRQSSIIVETGQNRWPAVILARDEGHEMEAEGSQFCGLRGLLSDVHALGKLR